MRLLLDSHAFLWWLVGDKRLSATARRAIADGSAEVTVSAATIWELEVKSAAGRLDLGGLDLLLELGKEGFDELPIAARHAAHAARLPPHHSDPFDRVLVAQALGESLTLVTKDDALRAYGVPRLW